VCCGCTARKTDGYGRAVHKRGKINEHHLPADKLDGIIQRDPPTEHIPRAHSLAQDMMVVV